MSADFDLKQYSIAVDDISEASENGSNIILPCKTREPDLYLKVDGIYIPGHRAVLAFYSQVFKTLICGRNSLEASNANNCVIVLREHRLHDIKELMAFLYSQDKEITDENVLTLLSVAEEFLILVLLAMCEEFLIQSHTFDVILLLKLGRRHRLMRLVDHALSEASKIPGIEKRDSFYTLDEFEQSAIMRRVIERFRKASKVIEGSKDFICTIHKRFPSFPFCFNCSCAANSKGKICTNSVVAKKIVSEEFENAFCQDL